MQCIEVKYHNQLVIIMTFRQYVTITNYLRSSYEMINCNDVKCPNMMNNIRIIISIFDKHI